MSRREQNKYISRENILRASRRLFQEKGFENATIDEIAKKAGVSRATLYNYFPGKESLLLGIIRAELDLIRSMLLGELWEASPENRLRRALETYTLDSISYLSLSRKLNYLIALEDNPLHPVRGEILEIFTDLTEECRAQGVFRTDLPAAEIVELLLSVYLTLQFNCPGIGEWSAERCREKLDTLLSHALADVWAPPVSRENKTHRKG